MAEAAVIGGWGEKIVQQPEWLLRIWAVEEFRPWCESSWFASSVTLMRRYGRRQVIASDTSRPTARGFCIADRAYCHAVQLLRIIRILCSTHSKRRGKASRSSLHRCELFLIALAALPSERYSDASRADGYTVSKLIFFSA